MYPHYITFHKVAARNNIVPQHVFHWYVHMQTNLHVQKKCMCSTYATFIFFIVLNATPVGDLSKQITVALEPELSTRWQPEIKFSHNPSEQN